jgi:serine/threonine protein kinase
MALEQLSLIRTSEDWLVWRGLDQETGERFTVKQVHPEAGLQDYLTKQLQGEYTFSQHLQHPGFLARGRWETALRVPGRSDATSAILFEDTQGNLDQLLRQEGPLPVDLVANVLYQCADALTHLHGKKMGHGAINTQTILIAPNGAVKFGDFTGYRFDQNESPLPPFHPLPYQAPEILNARLGTCSPTSDLYCLGFVALQMLLVDRFSLLFGEEAGVGGNERNWLSWHSNPLRELPDLREVLQTQEAIINLLAPLTQKRIEDRPCKTAAELAATIKKLGLTSSRSLPQIRLETSARTSEPAPARPAPTGAPATLKPGLTLTWSVGGQTLRKRFSPKLPVLVGSRNDCDLPLEDESISRRHALIACYTDTWLLFDLKSHQGTFVNNSLVREAVVLSQGDEVRFGGVTGQVVQIVKGQRQVPGFGKIGEIHLIKKLHTGASGELFLGQMKRSSGMSLMAIRLYPGDFSVDEEQVRRFIRGVETAAQFRHPNIVRLYRGGRLRNNQKWFLAMEYLPGRSLRDQIGKHGRLSVPVVLRMLRDLLQALKAIEKEQILHRNITPSCILFTRDGTAKLGDFLLMREQEVLETAHQITRIGILPGEKVYQAPEVVRGAPAFPDSDVYSVAAAAYEALTGRSPFPRNVNLPTILKAVQNDPVRPPREINPDIPPELERLLLKALAKTSGERFRNAAALERELRALNSGGGEG